MTEDYARFQYVVKQKTGLDLTLYKEKQMKRRLQNFYERYQFQSFMEFFEQGLARDDKLLHQFLDRVTINVSEFYRNKERWFEFEREIVPILKEQHLPLSVWSAACSTGEEPYTLSMVFHKQLQASDYHILATDLDPTVLEAAKVGQYSERSVRSLHERERQFGFHERNRVFEVKGQFKQPITFERHNLLQDRYPDHVDLIVCRNVLIYMTDIAKQQIIAQFSATLKPGGFLFVGSTEQLFSPEKYGLENYKSFIYRKKTSQ
ncbi:chemotaxis protein methyltransferase CheR [Geomicrobium sp. JCM 19037]|uniref:CheR family methyltransferase n=1 Tax=Geomicrobium sp. JCM 19037 TaxID=1460634 RepID=UPI00045F1DC4|nr:protein-glutamate O-methyltransferase CheR [Geomicrobium sp. JCM 19037]GAK02419.1 chemotaxis protein methyltransferase CheR [Geomicrobium sp. JCM 19037]